MPTFIEATSNASGFWSGAWPRNKIGVLTAMKTSSELSASERRIAGLAGSMLHLRRLRMLLLSR
jgi:hypothetical protein